MQKERCALKWAEVSIRTSHDAMELVSEFFYEAGASGVVMEDPEIVNSYIDAGFWDYSEVMREEQTEVVTVKAYFPVDEDLEKRLCALEEQVKNLAEQGELDCGPCTVSWNEVQDEDWSENWKQYFHTEKIGEAIVIKPAWEEYAAQAGDIVIDLDPSNAFGTGTHPTTALCIRALESMVKKGMRVFDVGTGSGVLAIAAAKLGAGEVVAMDYDRTAVTAAQANVERNHVGDLVSTGQSDLWAAFQGKADLVVANIIADIVICLLDGLKEHLDPRGKLLASGIITERVADVAAAALEHGLVVEKVMEDSGWAAMVISCGESV